LTDSRRRPHDARGARNDRNGDRDHDVLDGRSEDRRDREGEDELREREQDVHEPLEEEIDLAAEVRADHAEQATDRAARERRGEADEQRDARAVHDAAQQIAPELVRAEPVLPARARELRRIVRGVGVVRRQQLGRGGHGQHADDDDGAGGAERLLAREVQDGFDGAEPGPQRCRGAGVRDLDVGRHSYRYRIRGSNHA
jgi:hypothetical protein